LIFAPLYSNTQKAMSKPEQKPQFAPAPLVEVLDLARRVVAVLPASDVARQKLRHRSIAIMLFDDLGRLNLRRRDQAMGKNPGRWDVSVRGPVLTGESVQDAATRALEAELGIHSERLRPILELPAQPENGNEFLHVFTLTRGEPPAPSSQDHETGDYSFTIEELDCLLRDFRDLVSPRFLLLAEALSLKGLWRRRP
jgi:isopentenyl-diphosphate Delta-isomerase